MRRGPLPVGAGRLAALAVAVATAAPSASLEAQAAPSPLEAADRAFEEGRLGAAGRSYEDALRGGGLSPAAWVRAQLRLGSIAAAGGQLELARPRWAAALAVDPGAPAPEPLDEAAAALLEELRAERGERRLRVVLEISEPSAPIRVDLRDAPPGLVRLVVIAGSAGEPGAAAGAPWTRTLPWDSEALWVRPPAEARPIEARALDAHGNVLARAGGRLSAPARLPEVSEPLRAEPASPLELPSPARASSEEASGGSLVESPWLWIAVGVIVAAVAVVVGFTASGERYVLDAPLIR